MQVQEQINNLIDEMLIYLAKNNYNEEIERALKIYKSPFVDQGVDIDLEHGFNSWLIHDYQKKNGSYIIKDYLLNKNIDVVDGIDLFKLINESIFSIFKVSIQKDNVVFKDIITQVDYLIETDQKFNNADIIKIRIYPSNNKYYIVDNGAYFTEEFEPTIRKSVMSKYNEYCSTNEPMGIDEFVKKHSVLIYHLANIIDYYESELSVEDNLSVHMATYAVKNREPLIERLLLSGAFQIAETYDDEMVLTLLSDESQVAEIVITVNKIEIEATTKTLLSYAKTEFEKASGELAVFVKDEELFLEDLI